MVGANGGVGSLAVQLATAAGPPWLPPACPRTTTTSRPGRLRGPGPQRRHRCPGPRAPPRGVDALADFASRSPEQLSTYAAVVREGGRIASSAGAAGEGPVSRRDRRALRRHPGPPGRATGRRHSAVPIQASYPLAQVDQALKTLDGQHTQGKLVITVA